MRGQEEPDRAVADALDAYRAAACAEADAHFDDRTLEAQRVRIAQRLELAGQRARVLPFPGNGGSPTPVAPISRRWVSVAAAAGLLVGLVTGQLLHVLPGDRGMQRPLVRSQAGPQGRTNGVPARISAQLTDPDNDLLDAIDLAVTRGGASELRALHDLTFAYEPY